MAGRGYRRLGNIRRQNWRTNRLAQAENRLDAANAAGVSPEEPPIMPYLVDYFTVSTVGLESSPVAAALAGLRANEARFLKNKFDHVFSGAPDPQRRTRHRHLI